MVPVVTGVRHGDPSSGILFDIYLVGSAEAVSKGRSDGFRPGDRVLNNIVPK